MTEVKMIPLSLIDPSPFQVRTWMDPEKLESLALSFGEIGQQRPIKVRPEGDRYELIYGHRAVKALEIAGIETARAEVVEGLSDEEIIWIQDAENTEAEPETDWDLAKRFKLLTEKGITQAEIAQRKGKTQAWVSYRLQMLKLDPYFITAVIKSRLTELQAREILKAPEELLPEVCHEIEEQFNVTGVLPRPADIPDFINYVVAVRARPDLKASPEILREEPRSLAEEERLDEEEVDELELEDSELDQIPDEQRIVPLGTPEPVTAKPEVPSVSQEERVPAPVAEPRRAALEPTPISEKVDVTVTPPTSVTLETLAQKYPATAEYVADYLSKNLRPDEPFLAWSVSRKFGISELEAKNLIREVRAQPRRVEPSPPKPIQKEIDQAVFTCKTCGESFLIVHVEPTGEHKLRPVRHVEGEA